MIHFTVLFLSLKTKISCTKIIGCGPSKKKIQTMINYTETNEFNMRSKIDLLFLTLGLSAPTITNSSPQLYIHTIILPKPKCLCTLNSYVEILIPKNELLGIGAFGKYLGHEGGALTNGISVLIRAPSELPCPYHHVRTHGRWPSMNQEVSPYPHDHAVPSGLTPSLLNYEK